MQPADHHQLFVKRVALCERRVVHRLGALRVGRCVAFVDDAEHVESIQRLTNRF